MNIYIKIDRDIGIYMDIYIKIDRDRGRNQGEAHQRMAVLVKSKGGRPSLTRW